MAPPKPRKIDVNSLPAIPHTREHYGNNVSGVKDQPASYQACDLVMTGVFMGTWESMVPKYVQLSDRMVGNALLCGIAVTKLAEWYPCDFILLPGKVLGLTPGRQSSGHPSLDISGKVHLAFGQYLVGDHTHNVDIAAVGWAALTHATVGYDVGPFNEGVSKVIKTSQPYAKVKALLTCDKYYALKSKISAGDAQTEPTSSGSSAKKRKIGEPKGSSKIVDATTSTMLEAVNQEFQALLVSIDKGSKYDFRALLSKMEAIWEPEEDGYKSLKAIAERGDGDKNKTTEKTDGDKGKTTGNIGEKPVEITGEKPVETTGENAGEETQAPGPNSPLKTSGQGEGPLPDANQPNEQ